MNYILTIRTYFFKFFRFNKSAIYNLEENGFLIINSYKGDLKELGQYLCKLDKTLPTKIDYQKLSPKTKEEASNSLSSAFGLDEFPLHSDGAHYFFPPKYLILRSLSNSQTGTLIADSHELKSNMYWDEIKNSIWEVLTIDKGKIETKLFNNYSKKGIAYIRFNSLSMKCLNQKKALICKIIHKIPLKVIRWNKHKTVIIDNWRMLHGRESVKEINYKSRVLERVQIFV